MHQCRMASRLHCVSRPHCVCNIMVFVLMWRTTVCNAWAVRKSCVPVPSLRRNPRMTSTKKVFVADGVETSLAAYEPLPAAPAYVFVCSPHCISSTEAVQPRHTRAHATAVSALRMAARRPRAHEPKHDSSFLFVFLWSAFVAALLRHHSGCCTHITPRGCCLVV